MHAPQRHAKALNWTAFLTAILLVAPFVRALWQMLQAGETTWLPANGDALLFGAVIAAVLIGDSLRFGRPSRAFLLTLATCLATIGVGSAVFAVGVQFDIHQAHALADLTIEGPLLAGACAVGARLCLQKAFPEKSDR